MSSSSPDIGELEFRDLRTLVALLDLGSVRAAAQELGVSRATVRRRLQNLERAVGARLFETRDNGLVVHEAARALAPGARHIIEEAAAVLYSARSIALGGTETARVLLPEGLPPIGLTVIARLFAQQTSFAIDLRVSSDPGSELLDDVDIAVLFDDIRRGSNWGVHTVVQTPERLLATPRYLARNPARNTSDLTEHRLLVWRPPGLAHDRLPLVAGGHLTVRPHFVSADIHLLRTLALQDQGIAFIPDGGGVRGESHGGLVPVLNDVVGRARSLQVAFHARLEGLPRVRVLLELISQVVGSLRVPPPG